MEPVTPPMGTPPVPRSPFGWYEHVPADPYAEPYAQPSAQLPPVSPPSPPVSPPPPAGGPAGPHRRALAAAGVSVIALVSGLAGGFIGASTRTATTTAATPQASTVSFSGEKLDIAAIIAKVEPSVVSIESQVRTQRGPFSQSGTAAGTGIILTSDGEVLTNAHVVEGATTISVTLPGESTARQAKLVASDASHDLALLQIVGASGLPAAPLGTSSSLKVGDDVIAIGNALALDGGPTVTKGIVSALDRSIETEEAQMQGLIQTDAAISSGNSGGPLVNAAGQVIGINTAVAASSGTVNAANIGFAISIDQAQPIIDQLRGEA